MFNHVKLKQIKRVDVKKLYIQEKKMKSSAYQLRRKRDLVMFTGEKERES